MVSNEQLAEQFVKLYGIEPEVRVTCPGRVNLIGEHIDYHDYGVFPMAIDAATTILAAKNDTNSIVFSNFDSKYESWSSPIPCPWKGCTSPKWFDYLLCGWRGIMNREDGQEQFGMSFLLYGTIPPSSGLSSSSSLVCASALATLSLIVDNDPFEHISRKDFAHLCIESEPLIGTLSGGMDQAAEVLASEGTALRIDFNPLRSKNIQLPSDAVFVVVHSNTELNKGATSHYNERVIEGRIVAQIFKQKFNITSGSFRLKEIQTLSGKSFKEILKIVEELPDEVNKEQVIDLIGADKLEECLTENTRSFQKFKLRPRARHVFSEAYRVEQFESACAQKNIQEMGRLMNESHRSCAIDYECSCRELDEICRLYLDHGALGARLTGAGWGGCAVVLMAADDVDRVVAELPSLFVSKPAQGIRLQRF
ncbi:Galactokinase [Caenorhabditis elegans]|uniref:Galactokinase n=2 Tax=Caenorhabditis elegans TaxID=6239 RepID=O01969_CAEEL|nr:Galactokinase [Caenorhabditis elegans]CCD67952.1 Galactokinase [Caenorhabditis elegans]|eukprot:NP_490909.2 Uncharacterized protein CELE_M01D7.4 [Caenorhabditis elegans]